MISGPQPEADLGFCFICCLLAKGELGNAAESGIIKSQDIQDAVVIGFAAGIGPQFMGGNGLLNMPVPVCWTHLMGAKFAKSTGLAGPMDAPPGLLENLASGKG